MIVQLHREVHRLYKETGEDWERALDWILGYVDPSYSRKVSGGIVDWSEGGIRVDLPEYLLDRAQERFGRDIDLSEGVNLLLMAAYLLGGAQ